MVRCCLSNRAGVLMSDTIRTNMAEMGYEDLQDELIEILKERNDLEAQLAEARKPSVCRWAKTVNEWYPYTTGCEGVRRALLTNYCSNCGGKVEVVSDE